MITLLLTLFWLGMFALFLFSKQFATPHIKYSRGASIRGGLLFVQVLPEILLFLSLLFFSIALLDPWVLSKESGKSASAIPDEGVAIYLTLDRSGSMQQTVGRGQQTKMQLLKEVTKEFVKSRPFDLIGLIAFARAPSVLSPLTLDQKQILGQLEALESIKNQEEDGTALGYAIYKTAALIGATKQFAEKEDEAGRRGYGIKSSVMLVVTDGVQNPSNLDPADSLRHLELIDGAKLAKEQGVRLYLINIEPKITTSEYEAHRTLMKEAAELTGGKLFLLQSADELASVYDAIDQLEKSVLPEELKEILPRRFLAPYFLAGGALLFALSIFLQMTWIRRVP